MSLIIQNDLLGNYIKPSYSSRDIQTILDLLESKGTFNFATLDNGLFSAAAVNSATSYTGYSAVWIRDNIYLAHTHYLIGHTQIAIANLKTLMAYFQKFQWRFEEIIQGRVDPDNVMERPHVRFNGRDLLEIDQQWSHAQNDALGYFLWFYCQLVRERLIELRPQNLEILALFPVYFQAIQYWQDEDSGHWEEERKIAASSIGAVIAGLKSLKLLLTERNLVTECQYRGKSITAISDELVNLGQIALLKILPAECIQADPQYRLHDAALLFLIYPLGIVEAKMSERIVSNVIGNLQGDYGIRRYLGDSFWCRNYKDLPEEIRTSISSEREQWLKEHNRNLVEGEEAQWCVFDPIISVIFGLKFQKSDRTEDLERQTLYLNRSLGQLTGKNFELEFKCPELYYLQNNRYVANDATPLLWTQANLRIALKVMVDNL